MIALSAVARNSGSIALILLWVPSKSHSVGGGLKITFSGGGRAPREHGSGSQPMGSQTLHLLACLIQINEWLSSASALSPSKNTFTEGKTNTDNNHIEFWEFCSLPTTGILKLIILSPQLLHFLKVVQSFP